MELYFTLRLFTSIRTSVHGSSWYRCCNITFGFPVSEAGFSFRLAGELETSINVGTRPARRSEAVGTVT